MSSLRRISLLSFRILCALSSLSRGASAQVSLTHTEDASPIPAGTLRFRIVTGWSRYDERFVTGGTRSLDDEISTPALGSQQLPLIAARELGIQQLSNSATRLSFGKLDARSDVRTVTTPIALELGLTKRLSIGILVPVVQTRRNIHAFVNADSSNNVNFLAARFRGSAAMANLATYTAFKTAADSLGTLVSRCPTNPNANGCATVNANIADATATRLQAQALADAIRSGLGIDSASALIAPRTGSGLASAIDARRSATNLLLQKYLGANAGATTGVFTAAGTFSYIDLQGRNDVGGLLESPLGGVDSIQTTNRLVLGGLTLGAQWILFDDFARNVTTPNVLQLRGAIGGSVRFASLPADSGKLLGAIQPGTGSGFGAHAAVDMIRGKFGGTAVAAFDKSVARTVNTSIYGDPESYFVNPFFANLQRTDGVVITLDLTPLYFLTDWIALEAKYGLEHTGATTFAGDALNSTPCPTCNSVASTPGIAARSVQRAGFGLRYSTFDSYVRGGAKTPIEVSFTHLETITGDAGAAKIFRDQVQVRLFFPLLSR